MPSFFYAKNAFNSINRATMLENIKRTCPAVYTYAFNCYAVHARLFVIGGLEIRSQEGTTQGDPTAMAFYALGMMPFLWKLKSSNNPSDLSSYADDIQGIAKLLNLRSTLDICLSDGPKYGFDSEGSNVGSYSRPIWKKKPKGCLRGLV